MAVTLSSKEKKALDDIFVSITEERNFFDNIKILIKKIKRFIFVSFSHL